MGPDHKSVDRRWILATLGTGTTLAVAGCLDGSTDENAGGTDDSADESDPADGAEADDGDTDDESTTPSLDEPAAFPTGDEGGCGVCNMHSVDYPDWNTQVVHEDGHREYFCSTGCLIAYYYEPTAFGGEDADGEIVGVWATSFESGELADATEGYFVFEQDRDRHDYPMPRGSPPAFEDREAALAYVEEYDDRSEDDLFTLEDVDEEIATFYRGPVLEDALEE